MINSFPNDGCAIDYCISQISLLDMKAIFCWNKSALFQFEIAFSDIWILPTPRGGGDICFYVEKQF